MTSLPNNVNAIGELQACRSPAWYGPFITTALTGAPSTTSAGAPLDSGPTNGSPAARVVVQMREEVHRRSARVTVTTRDASANYTVTIAGTAIATTSGSFATDDIVLVELKAKIDADATVGQAASSPLVDSELLDAAGDVTVGTAGGGEAAAVLRVFGEGDADYTVAVSASGSGVLACKADPTNCTARIWLAPRGSAVDSSFTAPTSAAWAVADSGNKTVGYRGVALNLETGGWSRCYVELDSLTGTGDGAEVTYTDANSPKVWVGPAARETSD